MTITSRTLHGKAPMASLAEVLAWAERAGEDYNAICELKKVPARMGYTDDDIGLIPADLRHFETVVAPTAYGVVAPRATDIEAARRRGNARARTLLQRFQAARFSAADSTGRDDWTALIAFVKDREGFAERGAMFPTSQHMALTMLRARARVAPQELTQDEVDRIATEATAEKRKSLRKAVRFLNRLRALSLAHPQILALLPSDLLAIPRASDRAERLLWTSLPLVLRDEVEAATVTRIMPFSVIAEQVQAGIDAGLSAVEANQIAIEAAKAPRITNSAAARTAYRLAVAWLYRAARDRGWTCPAQGALASLFTQAHLTAACRDQVDRSEDSLSLRSSRETSTLWSRLTTLGTIAGHGLKDAELAANVALMRVFFAEHVVRPGARFNPDAERVCLLLKRNPELAAQFVQAPGLIAKEAQRRLEAACVAGDRSAELAALRLYIAAVLFAVQVSRPLRPENLIEMRYRASVEAPSNLTWIASRQHAELTFEPGEIKNARAIRVHLHDAEARILWTWMKDLRPRYLALRGIADTPYIVPGEASPRHPKDGVTMPSGCIAPSTLGEIWSEGDRILGLGITPHQCRHAVATLILAIAPGNFDPAASVLGNSAEACRKHYGRDSGEQAALQVRQALKARHPLLFERLRKDFTK